MFRPGSRVARSRLARVARDLRPSGGMRAPAKAPVSPEAAGPRRRPCSGAGPGRESCNPCSNSLDDRPLGMIGGGLLEEGIVQVRVERRAHRLDRLDAMLGQDVEQLPLHHIQTGGDPFGTRRPQGVDGPAEVVQRIEEVLRQRSDRVHPIGVGLLLGPLLIVGELGPGAERLLAEIVALLLQPGDLIGGRSGPRRPDQSPSAGRPARVVSSSRSSVRLVWGRSCSTPQRDSPRRPGSRPGSGIGGSSRPADLPAGRPAHDSSESSGSASSVK